MTEAAGRARAANAPRNGITEAADRATVANAHFLRARISTSDPALIELTTGLGVLANAVEAVAVVGASNLNHSQGRRRRAD
jgi:hypothetical protein